MVNFIQKSFWYFNP